MSAAPLDLRAVEEEVAILDEHQLKRLGGAILSLTPEYVLSVQRAPDRLRALLAHCRALRAALQPLGQLMAESPAWVDPALIPGDEYVHVRLRDVRAAASVLVSAVDAAGAAPEETQP